MKHFFLTPLFLALAASSSVALAAGMPDKHDVTDNNIVYPESMDTDVRDLMTEWYMNRYAVLDDKAKMAIKVDEVSDKEYIERLQQLQTEIEMPFNSVVRQYIEMYANKRAELVEKMLSLSLYYNPIFEDALEKYGLPNELKYLPVIESALNPNAVSKAGAAGLWQFMPSTGTGEGLEVTTLVDERRDPIKSSEAAASLLKKYYGIYNDWSLTLAAYNCGPGNVNKAIKRAGDKRDFWEIYNFLPKETRGYVPAFIAANYIMNNFSRHGISPAVARAPIVTDTVHVNQRVHFQQISDVLGISIDELRVLNPQYRKDIIPGNSRPYALILPSVQAYCYAVNEDSILAHNRDKYQPRYTAEPGTGRSTTANDLVASDNMTSGSDSTGIYVDETIVRYHTVQRGETLKSIAAVYGVTPESIRQDNDLSSAKVKRGKKLKITTTSRRYMDSGDGSMARNASGSSTGSLAASSTSASASSTPARTQKQASAASSPAKKTTAAKATPKKYKVKAGDSLSLIARNNNTTVDQLMKANNLKGTTIHPGQTLVIPAKTAATAKKKTTTARKSTAKKR